MDKLNKFFECLIPVSACNLQCEYCYIIQRDERCDKMPNMKFSVERIGLALRKERVGGTCFFSICGKGETLLPHETIDIVLELLKVGHYVNITTNGTLSNRFDEIIAWPKEYLERLHVSFSLHYCELKRLNLMDDFISNVHKILNAGCSILIQINLCDEYIKLENEIKQLCLKEFGALPQVALTRREIDLDSNIYAYTNLSLEEYIKAGDKYDSPLFDCMINNFNKKVEGFCYAGKWSYTLNLADGILSSCYTSNSIQNIFEDIDKPINLQVVGQKCKSPYCMNAHHFMALGVMPDYEMESYEKLRSRVKLYTNKMSKFLNQKLYENNDYDKEDIFSHNHMNKLELNNNQWTDKVWMLKRLLDVNKVELWVLVVGENLDIRLGIGSDLNDMDYNEYIVKLDSGMSHIVVDLNSPSVKRGNINYSSIRKVVFGGMSFKSDIYYVIKVGKYLLNVNGEN